MTISVIVPVYNVQDYIYECVDSIINQDMKDFELLLIDDGSTDQSGKICDELKALDARIQVYHKVNGGLSDARNYGIEKAKGDYLTFIDSDDFILPGYLRVLLELVMQYNADVSCIQAYLSSDRASKPNNLDINTGSVSGIEAISDSLLRINFGVSACGKLYKACLFNNIRYPKGKLFEDLLTVPYIFEKCNRVAYSTENLYFYYNRPGSITHTKITTKHLELLDESIKLIQYLDQNCKEAHNAAVARFCIDSIKRLVDIALFTNEYFKYIHIIRKKSIDYWKEGLGNPLLAKSIKIQIAVLSRSTILYWLVFRPYKVLKHKSMNSSMN